MAVHLITGISGQAGSFLAESLLTAGHQVHGIIRRTSAFATPRIDHLRSNPAFHLHHGDLLDPLAIAGLLRKLHPDAIYNLAAQSHVRISFEIPTFTFNVNATAVLNLLEAVRQECPQARFLQASSSEQFGSSPPPQHELTPFAPRSPYAVSKVAAYHLVRHYREAYGLFAANAVLFNYESPRRHPNFVTRKISRAVARIKLGLDSHIELGNLSARRDWMHASDAVRGMRAIIEHDIPDDFVLATGESRSVSDFLNMAIAAAGMGPETGKAVPVHINPYYRRPTEVDALCGDATKARRILGWEPTMDLLDIVREMVEWDLIEEGKNAK